MVSDEVLPSDRLKRLFRFGILRGLCGPGGLREHRAVPGGTGTFHTGRLPVLLRFPPPSPPHPPAFLTEPTPLTWNEPGEDGCVGADIPGGGGTDGTTRRIPPRPRNRTAVIRRGRAAPPPPFAPRTASHGAAGGVPSVPAPAPSPSPAPTRVRVRNPPHTRGFAPISPFSVLGVTPGLPPPPVWTGPGLAPHRCTAQWGLIRVGVRPRDPQRVHPKDPL